MINRGGMLKSFQLLYMVHAQFDSLWVTYLARFAVTVAQMACLTPRAGASTGAFPSHCNLCCAFLVHTILEESQSSDRA